MKRVVIIAFLSLALLGASPLHAYAQNDGSGCDAICQQAQKNAQTQLNQPLQVSGPSQLSGSAAATSSTPTTGTGAGANADPSAVFGPILGTIMSLFAYLAGIAGILLENTVYYTVLQMGTYIHGLSAIGVAWRVLRDIGNIVLIFGFIAIGISTILGSDKYGAGKRLPTLIIVAVLLNFSLFIAEAIIDTGNLFATQFYTEINGGQQASAQPFPSSYNGVAYGGISGLVMNRLGLQTLYNVNSSSGTPGAPASSASVFSSPSIMLVAFLGIILFIVTAFVLFSLAFILIARFIALVFLIVVAPIGFAGLLIPGLDKTAYAWWSYLINQTVTAPAMLLMLYVALAVINDSYFLVGTTSSTTNGFAAAATQAAAGGGVSFFANILLSFAIAMGLLIACTIIAKRLGAFGASAATKMGGALSFGAVAFVGRRTVGRVSNATASGIRQSRFGRSDFGRFIASGFDYGAKSSFDIRGNKVVQDAAKEQKLELGTPQKGGYQAIQKASEEERTKYAKDLKLTEEERRIAERLDKELAAAEKTMTKEQFKQFKKNVETERVISLSGGREVKGLNALRGIAQSTYAESLAAGTPSNIKSWRDLWTIPYAITAGARANRDAAIKVRLESKKTKSSKDVQAAIQKVVEEGEEGVKAEEKKTPEGPGETAETTETKPSI